jgi:DNA invertase Pin-like site-specific DNA recombinase
MMTWAIDRIGRSLIDLLHTIQHLESAAHRHHDADGKVDFPGDRRICRVRAEHDHAGAST